MKAYEIDIYPADGDVFIAQGLGASEVEAAGMKHIRISPDQIEQLCKWLRESAAVAREQQGRGD